jgi:hypothetical protein
MTGEYQPITVSRRISAPADEIFQILADPRNHLTLDGSGMVREVASGTVIGGVGDVFVMRMYFTELGGYHMINQWSSLSRGVGSAGRQRRAAGTPTPSQELSARPGGVSGGRLS